MVSYFFYRKCFLFLIFLNLKNTYNRCIECANATNDEYRCRYAQWSDWIKEESMSDTAVGQLYYVTTN